MSYISRIKQPALIQEPTTCVLNFDETEVVVQELDGSEVNAYNYETVRVEKSDYNYAGLVSAIVRSRYSESAVEAIVLNGKDTAEHEAEYNALQTWRAHAKRVAHGYVG